MLCKINKGIFMGLPYSQVGSSKMEQAYSNWKSLMLEEISRMAIRTSVALHHILKSFSYCDNFSTMIEDSWRGSRIFRGGNDGFQYVF